MRTITSALPRRLGAPPAAAPSALGANMPTWSSQTVAAQVAKAVGVPDVAGYFGSCGDACTNAPTTWARTIGGASTGIAPTQFAADVCPASLVTARGVRVRAAMPTTVTLGSIPHVSEPSPVTSAHAHRAREWAWRVTNVDRLRREFLGQWIVLEGEEIVGHGADPVALVDAARTRGIRAPYVFRVEDEAKPNTSPLGMS